MREDHLVAVNTVEKEGKPAIGKVLKVREVDVVVQWMKWGYLSSWKPWTLQKGKKVVPWEDALPKESIILYDFELGNKGHYVRNP